MEELVLERTERGRIKRLRRTDHGADPVIYEYSYDKKGRLNRVELNGIPVEEYLFDPNDNFSSFSDGLPIAPVYDQRDWLLDWGELHFDYNARDQRAREENTVTGATELYWYDEVGRLRRRSAGALGQEFEYSYDAADRLRRLQLLPARVRSRIDTTMGWGINPSVGESGPGRKGTLRMGESFWLSSCTPMERTCPTTWFRQTVGPTRSSRTSVVRCGLSWM